MRLSFEVLQVEYMLKYILTASFKFQPHYIKVAYRYANILHFACFKYKQLHLTYVTLSEVRNNWQTPSHVCKYRWPEDGENTNILPHLFKDA
jgi:hypothetical protein